MYFDVMHMRTKNSNTEIGMQKHNPHSMHTMLMQAHPNIR